MKFIPLTMVYEKDQADEENEGRLERLTVIRADLITGYDEAWGVDAKFGYRSYVYTTGDTQRINVKEDIATIWGMMHVWTDSMLIAQIQDRMKQ